MKGIYKLIKGITVKHKVGSNDDSEIVSQFSSSSTKWSVAGCKWSAAGRKYSVAGRNGQQQSVNGQQQGVNGQQQGVNGQQQGVKCQQYAGCKWSTGRTSNYTLPVYHRIPSKNPHNRQIPRRGGGGGGVEMFNSS